MRMSRLPLIAPVVVLAALAFAPAAQAVSAPDSFPTVKVVAPVQTVTKTVPTAYASRVVPQLRAQGWTCTKLAHPTFSFGVRVSWTCTK